MTTTIVLAILIAMSNVRNVCLPSLLALLVVSLFLASCAPGHVGGNEIAFIRDGHIWTIDPDGANAFQIVSQDTPVIGYSWSPNHQLLVFRTLDSQFAKTEAAKQLATYPVTGQLIDAPSTLNTIGIDGGTPIPIMLSDVHVQFSNPYWNPSGTRLIYRQEPASTPFVAGGALWWVSQNDQPEGIAAKHLPPSYSLPSVNNSTSTAIGNSQQGMFTTTLQGTNVHYLLAKPLPGHPLPATLERLLWQPAHAHPLLLYATSSDTSHAPSSTVQLTTLSQDGQVSSLITCTCTQFAWSPDGTKILYSANTSSGSTDTIFDLATHSTVHIDVETGSVPYWSPNSAFLLFDGTHQLQLMNIATGSHSVLLTDSNASNTPVVSQAPAGINALVQPVPNSLWDSDSLHFLFLTHQRLMWQGKHISPGLYAIALNAGGTIQGTPTLVDAGNDAQPGWSFQSLDTTFLF